MAGTNASSGFEKADRTSTVGVEEWGGLAAPAECDCPADTYRKEYDCRYKVALATVGGPTVLEAADKSRADGGPSTSVKARSATVQRSRTTSRAGRVSGMGSGNCRSRGR